MLAIADRWNGLLVPVYRREPEIGDSGRWRLHDFGDGIARHCVQPITFTPYAAARPCSARCRFCSENLSRVEAGVRAARLRPGSRYGDWLDHALRALRGLPLSYSLSGLETSDDADWMIDMLQRLDRAAQEGLPVAQRVLYSNGAGFAGPRAVELLEALGRFRLSWVELSRHHHEAAANQSLMRFRHEVAVAGTAAFGSALRSLRGVAPVKLVCIVQRGGVACAEDVRDYLGWAVGQGASAVIFREFSRLSADYRHNATARYIERACVSVENLLFDCLDHPELTTRLEPVERTQGYYFRNLRLRHASGMDVIFECSDYAQMQRKHDSERVYKLVFFPNGRLCADWQPDHNLLLDCSDGHE